MGLESLLNNVKKAINDLSAELTQSKPKAPPKPKPQKHYLVIKSKSITSLLVSGFQFGNDSRERYQILDDGEKIKYRAYAQNTISDRDILDVYDDIGNKIGHIKEHFVSARVFGI